MKGTQNSNSVKKTIGENLSKARGNTSREVICQRITYVRRSLEENPNIKDLQPDTYKQWERGANKIDIEWIPAICDVLGCDVGYLFGDYDCSRWEDCKTRNDQFIHDITGLSAQSIARLKTDKKFILNASAIQERHIQEDVSCKKVMLEYVNALITSTALYRLALAYNSVQIAKEDFAQWESDYKRMKATCDERGKSKEDFKRERFNDMRNITLEALFDYQHFLEE